MGQWNLHDWLINVFFFISEKIPCAQEKIKGKRRIHLAQHVSFTKHGLQYTATSISDCDTQDGGKILLQPDNSEVQLELISGSGHMSMCVHRDALLFSKIIPENECIISPIIEINADSNSKASFKSRIRIPHCLRKKSDHRFVIVRHGDVYKDKDFRPVPYKRNMDATQLTNSEEYYEMDEHYIYVYATSYSQFTCTSCKRKCDENMIMFLSAGFSRPGNQRCLEIKPFICSPLFDIKEYRKVWRHHI